MGLDNIKKPKFPNLEAEIAYNGLTYKVYGELVGLSSGGVSDRLKGNVRFTLPEIKRTMLLFGKEFTYLFYEND